MVKKGEKSVVKKTPAKSSKQAKSSDKKPATGQSGKKTPTKTRPITAKKPPADPKNVKSPPQPILRSELHPNKPANPRFMPNNQKPALHRRPLLVYTK
jgi:hypothetical protein